VVVRDDLHLHVTGTRHQLLEEYRAVSEALLCFGPCGVECVFELRIVEHATNPSTTSARGRLDHHRVPESHRVVSGLGEVINGASAPRCDRHPCPFGKLLRGDLVAELSHHVAGGADELDSEPLAKIRELRSLGRETPARPHRLGAGLG